MRAGEAFGIVSDDAIMAADRKAGDGVLGSADASRDRHLEALSRLPQAALLAPENVSRRLADALRIDPERVEWRIRRAGGFEGGRRFSAPWTSGFGINRGEGRPVLVSQIDGTCYHSIIGRRGLDYDGGFGEDRRQVARECSFDDDGNFLGVIMCAVGPGATG